MNIFTVEALSVELCGCSALLFWRFYLHQNLYFIANLCV